jgi:hypothetical protein
VRRKEYSYPRLSPACAHLRIYVRTRLFILGVNDLLRTIPNPHERLCEKLQGRSSRMPTANAPFVLSSLCSPQIVADARVPTLWELVRKGIERQLAQASWTSRSIFKACVRAKTFLSTYGLPGAWLLDEFVLAKVTGIVGGEVFWSLCGGSTLSEDTQRFISGMICPPGGAYGMTETCA